MAKDDRIWILENYYMGFIKGLNQNQYIEHIPSKSALENAGCNISGMCYLITPGGSQFNPRTIKPNELPSSIRALFEPQHYDDEIIDDEEESIVEPAEEAAEVCTPDEPEKVSDYVVDATSKVCEECKESKPLEAFKKMPGRGVKRRAACIECETKAKEHMPQFKDESTPAQQHDQEPKSEVVEDAVVVPTKPTVAVTLEYLKRIATEAFERGREFERSNVETIEMSLDELLGIGA